MSVYNEAMEVGESQNAETDKKHNWLSRRNFLKVAAAGTAALALGANEIIKNNEGIITDYGIFIPIYEQHDIDIDEKLIPNDADGYFKELVLKKDGFDTPQSVLLALGDTYRDGKMKRIFQDRLFAKLAQNNCPLIIGDLNIPESDELLKTTAEFFIGGITLGFTHATPLLTRRRFLKFAGTTASFWAMSPLLTNMGARLSIQEKSKAAHAFGRIFGAQSTLHPEFPNYLFRNLKMADSIFTSAAHIEQVRQKKPKIAYTVEYRHSGIEDLLQLGPNVVRAMLAAYPANYLKKVTELNGEDELYTTRIITMPRNLTGIGDQQHMAQVTETKVIDFPLKISLANKMTSTS